MAEPSQSLSLLQTHARRKNLEVKAYLSFKSMGLGSITGVQSKCGLFVFTFT
jgi:hypothetical protein